LENEDIKEEELLMIFNHWDEKDKEGDREGGEVGIIEKNGDIVGYRVESKRIGENVGDDEGRREGRRDGETVGRRVGTGVGKVVGKYEGETVGGLEG
jgi:hypothetical protein